MSVLAVTQMHSGDDWVPVSGRARLAVQGRLTGLNVGDEVDVIGQLSAPSSPGNPGESDYAAHLLDQRIRAVVIVRKTADGVVRLGEGWPQSWRGWLAMLRGAFKRMLEEAIPEKKEQGLAIALLLGDGTALPEAEWDKYKRTGVVHVLVVSGQQLTVLGWFLWFVLRRLGMRGPNRAVVVAGVLLVYALLVGGSPPALRAAVMAMAICGGLLVRRPVRWANVLALSWLVVGAVNPADWCSPGCQLSFLCVAADLLGYPSAISGRARSAAPSAGRGSPGVATLRAGPRTEGVGALCARPCHLACGGSPRGDALQRGVARRGADHALAGVARRGGPGHGLLAAACGAVCWPLALALGRITGWCLALSDGIVDLADRVPGGQWPAGGTPDWWLWLFYLVLLSVLMLESLRRHRHWFALAGLAWVCVGLVGGVAPRSFDELRCTFLAVGHGGCTLMVGLSTMMAGGHSHAYSLQLLEV